MTYKQFLSKLRKTNRDWFVAGGFIRRKDEIGSYCPITAVAGAPPSRTSYWGCFAIKIELDYSDAEKIVLASDQRKGFDAKIRRDLLKACGLK